MVHSNLKVGKNQSGTFQSQSGAEPMWYHQCDPLNFKMGQNQCDPFNLKVGKNQCGTFQSQSGTEPMWYLPISKWNRTKEVPSNLKMEQNQSGTFQAQSGAEPM